MIIHWNRWRGKTKRRMERKSTSLEWGKKEATENQNNSMSNFPSTFRIETINPFFCFAWSDLTPNIAQITATESKKHQSIFYSNRIEKILCRTSTQHRFNHAQNLPAQILFFIGTKWKREIWGNVTPNSSGIFGYAITCINIWFCTLKSTQQPFASH